MAIRGVLTVLLLGIGYVAVTRSFAAFLQERRPLLAHALASGNARATARLAFDMFLSKPVADPNAPANKLAHDALRADATAVPALVVLGLGADLRGQKAESRRYFDLSQRLSRRNLPTQIWAIEDAVGRGDVAGALTHYDIALRTSASAPNVLYPVLTEALAQPQIRAGLVTTFAGHPAWQDNFIAYSLANSTTPRFIQALFDDMRRSRIPVTPDAYASLVSRLVLFGDTDAGWRMYAAMHPGVDRRRSRDPRFEAGGDLASPFGWSVTTSGEVSGTLQRSDSGGALVYTVSPNGGGIIAQQLQYLPAGTYKIEGRSSASGSAQDLPYWVLRCRGGGDLGRVPLTAGQTFRGTVAVPQSCPVQILALVGQPSTEIAGVSGQVTYLALAPATND